MNGAKVMESSVQMDSIDSLKISKNTSSDESKVNVKFTCMSCDKIVTDVELHLKREHNIDRFQVVGDQAQKPGNDHVLIDVSQSDVKSEDSDDEVEEVLDCMSLAELEGYLPIADYSTLKGEDKVVFVCKNCDGNFDNFVDLKDHSIMQHNNLIQRRDCRHCYKMLDSHRKLMVHLKEHHCTYKSMNKIQKIIDRIKMTGDCTVSLRPQNTDNFGYCFSCSECGKVFRLKSSLALHQKRIHSSKKISKKDIKTLWCLECHMNFSDVRDLRKHRNDIHSEPSFLCINCDTVFPSRGSLNLHNIYHHRIHWCSPCNIDFPGRLALTSHVKKHHPGMPVYRANSRFVCEYCSQSFSIRSQLSDHIQSVHLGLINQCEDCGKILATSETLKVHRLKHRPEMHRTCEHCGRQFYRTGMLTEHIRACHPEALPDDWRLHTTCPYCQASFTRRESMRRHIEAKHEPKSLSCSFCDRLFTCRRYLVRHENKHHLGRNAQ